MAKWVCNICGYIYDPEVGDPDNGVAAGTTFMTPKQVTLITALQQAPLGKMYRKTGFAPSAVQAKTSSANNKKIKKQASYF